jgi:hypothetical protein
VGGERDTLTVAEESNFSASAGWSDLIDNKWFKDEVPNLGSQQGVRSWDALSRRRTHVRFKDALRELGLQHAMKFCNQQWR